MVKRTTIALILLSFVAHSQVMEQLKKTVTFIYDHAHVRDKDGKSVLVSGALGTAFFLRYPDKRGGDGYGFTYTVTAKHVLMDELEGRYLENVAFRANASGGKGASFSTPIPVSDSRGDLLWLDDKDDPNADVAITLYHPRENEVDYLSIALESFATADVIRGSHVSEGDSVYLIGLMPQFTGETHNYPVVRRGSIALLSNEPIPTGPETKQNAYLVELGSWPGHSGAPVFLNLGGYRNGDMALGESYYLLGLMLGYFQNGRPFEQIQPTNSVLLGDTSNIGISVVLPASEILKVLQSKEAQQERDADIARTTKK